MIYIDSSVVLAHLFAEIRRPPEHLWVESLVASRLVEYEVWNRLHARGRAETHGEAAEEAIGQIALLELSPVILTRALGAFPAPVRTLDALHLASLDYLRGQRQGVELATYDRRMAEAARAMEIPVLDLGEA
ncbi:MAG: type II toxin-antitoxin system VapC family toxin [Holophagales bacterium]|nr:type II toxin-antitoxin system VapC family toxin [Holophagales bacterium]MYG29991.1 type II toxin-antitoxin system VapC family toxin [Holophagales bacterium]MYI78670.1 type II toxin-antitoxin system VapC family toxin [Holophagales bacterium]